jgi:hypothetical protein
MVWVAGLATALKLGGAIRSSFTILKNRRIYHKKGNDYNQNEKRKFHKSLVYRVFRSRPLRREGDNRPAPSQPPESFASPKEGKRSPKVGPQID